MKRRNGWPICFLMLCSLLATPTSTAEVDVEERLTSVTVYHDFAEALRVADVVLPAGPVTIVFRDLPDETDADSLQARTVAGDARIAMVEMVRRRDERDMTAQLELREEITRHEDAIAEIESTREVTQALRKYVVGVLDSSAELQGSKVFEGGGEPEVIAAVYDMARSELTELARSDLDARPRLRVLEARVAEAKARLRELEQQESVHHDVRVELEVDAPGEVRLELGYAVSGASWKPAYRAELDGEGESVRLVTEAVVTQSTGENWDGVRLQLSSSSPTRRLVEPRLDTWWLTPQAEPGGDGALALSPGIQGSRTRRLNPNSIGEMEVITGGAGAEFGRAQGGFARIIAAAGPSGYTVNFDVPGEVHLTSDGVARRVILRVEELDASPVYRAVPSKDPRAYLVVNTLAPQEYPLLAGPVRVYNEAAYLGSARIPETGPGGRLSLPFGVDNRIELTHVPSRLEGDGGWSGKQRVTSRSSRTLIHNLHERPITLIVEDRVPVARDERIEVKLAKQTTSGHKPSKHRPGVILWELELESREEREVELSYEVRHPIGMALQASR